MPTRSRVFSPALLNCTQYAADTGTAYRDQVRIALSEKKYKQLHDLPSNQPALLKACLTLLKLQNKYTSSGLLSEKHFHVDSFELKQLIWLNGKDA